MGWVSSWGFWVTKKGGCLNTPFPRFCNWYSNSIDPEGPSHFILHPLVKFMDWWETGEGLHMLRGVCVERMDSHFSLSHCVSSRVVAVSYFSFKICFSLFHYTAYVWEFPSKSKWDGKSCKGGVSTLMVLRWDLPSAQTRREEQVLLLEDWPGGVVCFDC